MSKIGKWVSTKDNKIIEVQSEDVTKNGIIIYDGREVEFNDFIPLRYGNNIVVDERNVLEEET